MQRILIAEDNEDIAESLVMLLKIMGHEVRRAVNGQEAIEIATTYQPKLILLDIGMPKLNGYDACRAIREQEWSKDSLIVAMTGWGQEADKLRAKEAGFDKHLVKPIELEILEEIVAAL